MYGNPHLYPSGSPLNLSETHPSYLFSFKENEVPGKLNQSANGLIGFNMLYSWIIIIIPTDVSATKAVVILT